ncbi:hypothetical protein KR074_011104 [Drosophila pseudoananassae]|nr:hypothetical protein KR074_011104 [Drosophila pseudoananassae]
MDKLNPHFELVHCPRNCVCQLDYLKNLPIGRWVEHGKDDTLISDQTKLVTCLFQTQREVQKLLDALPLDLQALILLYTGKKKQKLAGEFGISITVHVIHLRFFNNSTVNSSSFLHFNHLKSLEFRGIGATFFIDEPLQHLRHAYFEDIQLKAGESSIRPNFAKLPNQNYKYKPRIEQSEYYSIKNALNIEKSADQVLVYDQHIQRQKQVQMPSFYGWNRLKTLRIHKCHLEDLHWQMFDGMTQLMHLSLEGNGIEELPPFAFSGAQNLKSISLAHNMIRRLHYLGLAGLLELENLQLSNNLLVGLNEVSFPPLPMLQIIDLRSNPIETIIPATFWVMNDTKEIQIGSVKAALHLQTWNIFGQFDSLQKLKTLVLRNVSAESLEQCVFKGLYGLEVLTMHGRIIRIQFDVFAEMEKLKELDISHCMIQELSMDSLMGARRLQMLNLSYNQLTSVPPGLLDDQKELEVVQLQGNLLKSLPTSFFLLPAVLVVRLDQNPWQCTCQMRNWVYRLTNVMYNPTYKSCPKGIIKYNNICKSFYEMDKSLVPRCSNYNGRSVYYVLQRHLQCRTLNNHKY